MSVPVPSPNRLSSSGPLSIFIPTTPAGIPWLHHTHGGEHDFASNASLIPPQGPYVVLATPERITTPYSSSDDKADSSGGRREEENDIKAMAVNDPQSLRVPGAIRGRNSALQSQRVFHQDQPYPRIPSPTPSLQPHETPLELPQPTSPIRRKARFRRHNWLASVVACFQQSRLLVHPTAYLALYFSLNLGLTLYNKSLLISFPFPYTLSALHALCGSIGSLILVRAGSTPVPKLNFHETLILLAFSSLYTINIIVSNLSLGLVTVPFHQVVRAATPLFTILFSALILGIRSSPKKLVALLPVVAGVGFATYGDYYFTPWGFILTLFGTVLASLKTIYTNFLQVRTSSVRLSKEAPSGVEKHPVTPISPLRYTTLPPLTPLHLLYLLSPLAFLQSTFLAQYSGELGRVQEYMFRQPQINIFARTMPPSSSGMPSFQLVLLLINGFMAFGLNVVSFSANRKIGALSMTVAANVKQVLTILCAVAMFNLTITPMNAIGIILTLVGGAVYASVELKEKREKAAALHPK
ncbi:hypothetical protein C0991_002261 [Blastosporella zonata]|nr:hypothetical protein C0991_002261 [Blastosporella zonata]